MSNALGLQIIFYTEWRDAHCPLPIAQHSIITVIHIHYTLYLLASLPTTHKVKQTYKLDGIHCSLVRNIHVLLVLETHHCYTWRKRHLTCTVETCCSSWLRLKHSLTLDIWPAGCINLYTVNLCLLAKHLRYGMKRILPWPLLLIVTSPVSGNIPEARGGGGGGELILYPITRILAQWGGHFHSNISAPNNLVQY